ncbi:hypothetical protein SK128_017876 [Halocaridina rubra]|uniref:Uncharacterized protein n=1 Tax=Halocaridina rubra TaxID=373956 RepID=A0AAN8WGD9_HALRR
MGLTRPLPFPPVFLITKSEFTTDNCLWGLSGNGQICHHETVLTTKNEYEEPNCKSEIVFLSDECEDWEVL